MSPLPVIVIVSRPHIEVSDGELTVTRTLPSTSNGEPKRNTPTP